MSAHMSTLVRSHGCAGLYYLNFGAMIFAALFHLLPVYQGLQQIALKHVLWICRKLRLPPKQLDTITLADGSTLTDPSDGDFILDGPFAGTELLEDRTFWEETDQTLKRAGQHGYGPRFVCDGGGGGSGGGGSGGGGGDDDDDVLSTQAVFGISIQEHSSARKSFMASIGHERPVLPGARTLTPIRTPMVRRLSGTSNSSDTSSNGGDEPDSPGSSTTYTHPVIKMWFWI